MSNNRGEFILGSASTLPIELIDFETDLLDTNVIITWATASEINNDYFIVEKSSDGIHFVELEKVYGNGNSARIINYETIDYSPFYGKSYYRLKQVDYDKNYSYSDIITVENYSKKCSISIYPNPAQDYFFVKIDAPSKSNYEITIVDIMGRVVANDVISCNSDSFEKKYNKENLSNGLYNIIIKDKSNNEIIKTNKLIFK